MLYKFMLDYLMSAWKMQELTSIMKSEGRTSTLLKNNQKQFGLNN